MSEYQFYGFVAVDRPLRPDEIDALRNLSTRAEITPTSFTNEYHWGDFRGDPRTMIERYFDVFVYTANWGTRQVMFRLPEKLLSLETAQRYLSGDDVEAWTCDGNVILSLTWDDPDEERPEDYFDGEGWLASLTPVRDRLAAGDHRALYLGWLLSVQLGLRYDESLYGELDDDEQESDELEPFVPPNLADLDAPLSSLAGFLHIDQDLLTVAAAASKPAGDELAPGRMRQWVRRLPSEEKDQVILRLLEGDYQVGNEVRQRFLAATNGASGHPGSGERTVGELQRDARELCEQRRLLDEQARRRRVAQIEKKQARERKQRLDKLASDGEQVWMRIDQLVAAKVTSSYDEAVGVLCELRELAERDGDMPEFQRRVAQLREAYAKRPGLQWRLDKAGL